MGKINHNISNPNDGLGDQLRTGFANQNIMNTELYDTKVDKVAGKGLSANDFSNTDKNKLDALNTGAEVNVQPDWAQSNTTADDFIKNKPPELFSSVGSFHYVDSATKTTPLTVIANVEKKITNDTADTTTSVLNAPYGVTSMWNAVNSQLNFTQTSIGDLVTIIPSIEVTTTIANKNVKIYIKLGIGSLNPTTKQVLNTPLKLVGSAIVSPSSDFVVDTFDIKDFPAEIFIISDAGATVKSGELDIKIVRKSVNVVATHPANHPPSIITQDASNRFVTDIEKASWNAKQNIFVANVRDFGAIGNGINNDTASINAALASIPLKGGTLYFPNGTYNTTNGINIVRDNIKILGEVMPRTATSFIKLEGGAIVNGQFLIDGNNITVKNIGFDFGTTYSNTYRSAIGGNALVIHDSNLASIKKNINVDNVIGLIRMGNFNDIQAAFHAILIEGVQFGTANNVTGVGGWFGVVVKATDFLMSNITGLENDSASIYIKSNTYAPSARVTAVNLTTANYTARGNVGVLVQSSDAEMENISVSNVTVGGGNLALRVEAEATQPIVGFSLNGLVSRNTLNGVSIRGGVFSPVISNVVVYNPTNFGFQMSKNSGGNNAIDAIVSNIRIMPSATTIDAIKIDDVNFKCILNNINVSSSDGKTLIAGSVINLQKNSLITNYVGVLKRNGVVSESNTNIGGDVTTSIANIKQTANTTLDLANPTISFSFGYLGSDNPYLQSYNNVNNTPSVLDINPFGGDVKFGGNISAIPATQSNQVVVKSQLDASKPYKVYTALLSQTGTAAPVATILENTLGGLINWARNSFGIYNGTLNNAFVLNKTFANCSIRYNGNTVIFRQDANIITIVTANSAGNNIDDALANNSVEIRVYN